LSLPLTKPALEHLAQMRLAEATHLLGAGYYSGAFYLSGYAAELALKACISNAFTTQIIPDRRFVNDIYTHDLRRLVELAGLEADRITKVQADATFAENWEAVKAWSESSRYAICDETAAIELVEALRNRDHGIFEWIRSHW
jgi:HEPN domain-containing protein